MAGVEDGDLRFADPGDLHLVSPAALGLSQAVDLVGVDRLLVRARLQFLVSGVRPRAVEWLGGEWERVTDGRVWRLHWAGTHPENYPFDQSVGRFATVDPDEDRRVLEPQIGPRTFEPILLAAYETASFVGNFVTTEESDPLAPGTYRVTLQARLTGEGGAKRVLGLVDVVLPDVVHIRDVMPFVEAWAQDIRMVACTRSDDAPERV
jgi:hypothetical protein